MDEITVSVEKPSALTFVEGAGVEITRRKSSYIDVLPALSERTSEASRPRMTLDQYKRTQVKDEAAPRANYPPMHHTPTMDQYHDMKRKGDGSDRMIGGSPSYFFPTPEANAQLYRQWSSFA